MRFTERFHTDCTDSGHLSILFVSFRFGYDRTVLPEHAEVEYFLSKNEI